MEDDLFPDPISGDPWFLHLHAIGVTTEIWNLLEGWVTQYVFELAHIDVAHPLVPLLERAGNVSKADLLVKLADMASWEPQGVDAVAHFVRAFNICRENRNIMLHSRFDADDSGALRMRKLSGTGKLLTFSSDLEIIRQVAREMDTCLDYLMEVMFVGWQNCPANEMVAKMHNLTVERLPWPERPPLPRKLDPLPRPKAPQGG